MMFPRINKFSNISSTTSQAPTSVSGGERGISMGRRNDSSNIKNLIFGGYEEPV
jgi:hypothetical protein